jgi:tetratricopeptide (TPR) repeat protein
MDPEDKALSWVPAFVENDLSGALRQAGGARVSVLTRRAVETTLGDALAQPYTALYAEDGKPKFGKRLSATYVVDGTIVANEDRATVQVTLRSVETGIDLGGGKATVALEELAPARVKVKPPRPQASTSEPLTEMYLTGGAAEALILKGDSYYDIGMRDEARRWYEKALRHEGGSAADKLRACSRLGYLAAAGGDSDASARFYEDATALFFDICQQKYGPEYADHMKRLQSVWLDKNRGGAIAGDDPPCFGVGVVKFVNRKAESATRLEPGHVVCSQNEQIRVLLECTKDYYVYMWNMDSTGKVWPIHPDWDEAPPIGWKSEPVAAGQVYQAPPDTAYELDRNYGDEFLFYVVSRDRIPELDELMIYFGRHKSPTELKKMDLPTPVVFQATSRGIGVKGIVRKVQIQYEGQGQGAYDLDLFPLTSSEAAGAFMFRHQ